MSLVLAAHAQDYIGGLTAFRYLGAPDSAEAVAGIDQWIATFAAATIAAAHDAEHFEARIRALQDDWRTRLGSVRAGSAVAALIARLPGIPIINVASVAALLGRSTKAANDALVRLEAAGIVTQIRSGRRNRVWEVSEVIDELVDLERTLTTPKRSLR